MMKSNNLKIIMKSKTYNIKNKKGFTLLFAVLVSVLVLAIGTSMINIALKQIILSGSGRESQFAFYAANTGVECALYWDINGPEILDGEIKYVFPPPNATRLDSADLADITCGDITIATGAMGGSVADPDGKLLNYLGVWDIDDPLITTFRIAITNDTNDTTSSLQYCAEVTIEKEAFGDDVITTITSQGLNTCDPQNDARAVQRGLVLQYES